jgi:uncharacterized membrane protein YjjP (DUF1212 family)
MFFGRIYQWGKPFRPSWRSYAVYGGIVALILLAVEFGVLNVLPNNKVGGVLLIVPGFYFIVSVVFFVSDALLAGWRWFTARRKPKRRRKAAS